MTVTGVLADAAELYRLLFRRSIVVAGALWTFVYAVSWAASVSGDDTIEVAVEALYVILSFASPLLIQGALVELVNDAHEGRRPGTFFELLRRTTPRLLALLAGLLLYTILILLGFLLLIVPGLWVLARLSLIVPVIVLEKTGPAAALDRSSNLVQGHSLRVLGVLLFSLAIETGIPAAVDASLPELAGDTATAAVTFVLIVLTAPYVAHILSVLYYRLADRDRPLIHPELDRETLWRGT